jgi:muramidase (phage lysozyme)
MAYHDDLHDSDATVTAEQAVLFPELHLQFMDLALDPLPNLTVRVSIQGKDKIFITDSDGLIDSFQVRPGARLRIAVQRFDGSYKQIEDATMPTGDTTWNYISPQIALEVETQLHEGEAGHVEASIPKADMSDEGDRPVTKGSLTKDASMAAPSTSRTLEPKAGHQGDGVAQSTKPPAIRGNAVPPARQAPQINGRTEQGHPMAVLTQRVIDWWNSWTLPALNIWDQQGGAPVQQSKPGNASVHAAPTSKGSKVAYDPGMLPKVNTLIAFAEEQTEFEYGKSEGTAAVLAQMTKKQFEHERGEKQSKESLGRCYQYVRIALTRAGIVEGYLADKASAAVQDSASLAGQPLLDKGFSDVTDELPDARWAATGDVIVYSWSEATWAKRKKDKGVNTPNHGHIDIRSEANYISDYMPLAMHPTWCISKPGNAKEFEPNYVNIRIYRKYYDPRPTCRMHAFLACLREFETQAIASEADRYRALNTPLPTAPDQKLFTGYAVHPWSMVSKSEWAKGTSTASGAYQITLDTAEGFRKQRLLFDIEQHDMFSRAAQDRLAVMLIEEKKALGVVRKGDLDAAVKMLGGIWASLPGASQNQGRRTVQGKPMDIGYLREIYAKFLAVELAKFGIVE